MNSLGTDDIQLNRQDAPLVSIIIPTYNNLNEVDSGIESILKQDYTNIEIIITDDASKERDEKLDAIEQYIRDNQRGNIKNVIISPLSENVGTSRNINNGIRLCNGKYMRLVPPGDEIYDEKVVSKCVEYCERTKAQIVAGQSMILRCDNPKQIDSVKDTIIYRFQSRSGRRCQITPSIKDIRYVSGLPKEKRRKLVASRPIISTVAVFYTMKLLKKTKGFPTKYRLIEDVSFWPYLAKHGVDIHFIPLRMTKYSLGGISNGGKGSDFFWRDFPTIMKEDYISNEYRWGIFKPLLKRLRTRHIDWLNISRGDVVLKDYIIYMDSVMYALYLHMKFLLIGSRL